MEPAKATFRRREGFIPNPKLRLREQVHEVMRLKQFSLRTERAYWGWMKQYLVFHRKNVPGGSPGTAGETPALPRSGWRRPVSLTRLMTALRKSLVKST